MKRQFKFKKITQVQKEIQSPHKTNAKPTRKIYWKKKKMDLYTWKGWVIWYAKYDSVKLLEKKKKCKSKPDWDITF